MPIPNGFWLITAHYLFHKQPGSAVAWLIHSQLAVAMHLDTHTWLSAARQKIINTECDPPSINLCLSLNLTELDLTPPLLSPSSHTFFLHLRSANKAWVDLTDCPRASWKEILSHTFNSRTPLGCATDDTWKSMEREGKMQLYLRPVLSFLCPLVSSSAELPFSIEKKREGGKLGNDSRTFPNQPRNHFFICMDLQHLRFLSFTSCDHCLLVVFFLRANFFLSLLLLILHHNLQDPQPSCSSDRFLDH